jgi:3-deoxy-D-manno-octulosonate 8-phosphate phosphatase KdsC-like HAD superfamily phosphatase
MRARKLGGFIQGCSDKEAVTKKLLEERGLKFSEAMFIGNDIDDLSAMKIVGWLVAPLDAH